MSRARAVRPGLLATTPWGRPARARGRMPDHPLRRPHGRGTEGRGGCSERNTFGPDQDPVSPTGTPDRFLPRTIRPADRPPDLHRRREPRHRAGQSLPGAAGRRCDPDGQWRDVACETVPSRCLCTHGSPRPACARLDLRGVRVRSQPEGRPSARLHRVRPVRDADQQPGDGRPRAKRDGAVRRAPRERRQIPPRARQNKASELWSMAARPGTGPAMGRREAGARSGPRVCPVRMPRSVGRADGRTLARVIRLAPPCLA